MLYSDLESYKTYVNEYLNTINEETKFYYESSHFDVIYKPYVFGNLKTQLLDLVEYYIHLLKKYRITLDKDALAESLICGSIYNILSYISSVLLSTTVFVDKQKYKEMIETIVELSLNDLWITSKCKSDYIISLNIVSILYTNYLLYETKESYKLETNPIADKIKNYEETLLEDIQKDLKNTCRIDAYLILNDLLRSFHYKSQLLMLVYSRTTNEVEWRISGDMLKTHYIYSTHFQVSNYLLVLKNSFNNGGKKLDDRTIYHLMKAILEETTFTEYFEYIAKYGKNEEFMRMSDLFHTMLKVCGIEDIEKLMVSDLPEILALTTNQSIEINELTRRLFCYGFLKNCKNLKNISDIIKFIAKLREIVEIVLLPENIRVNIDLLKDAFTLQKYKNVVNETIGNYSLAAQMIRTIFKKEVFEEIKPVCTDLVRYYTLLIKNQLSIINGPKQKNNNPEELLGAIYEALCYITTLMLSTPFPEMLTKEFKNFLGCIHYRPIKTSLELLFEYFGENDHCQNCYELILHIVCFLYNSNLLILNSNENTVKEDIREFGNLEYIMSKLKSFQDIDAFLLFRDLLISINLNVYLCYSEDYNQSARTKTASKNEIFNEFTLTNTNFLITTYFNVLIRCLINDPDQLTKILIRQKVVIESYHEILKNGKKATFESLFNLIMQICAVEESTSLLEADAKKMIMEKFFSKLEKIKFDKLDKKFTIDDIIKDLKRTYEQWKQERTVSTNRTKSKICIIS